jgi:hypothetical protein
MGVIDRWATEPVIRPERYYAQRSTQNASKWAVMCGPIAADAVKAELTNGTVPSPKHVRGPLSHDRARSLARQLNKQDAEQ